MKKSKVALITGGTQGLGRELSLALAKRDYEVLALYKQNETAAAEWSTLMQRQGYAGQAIMADVTAPLSSAILEKVSGREIVVIHGAVAAFHPTPFQAVEWSEIERQTRVATQGLFNVVQSLLRPLVAEKGTVVAVLSKILHRNPMPKGFSAYVTAKQALRGLTQTLGSELGERGVRIFSVSPGFMDTPLTQAWDASIRNAARAVSDGRGPAQVAEAIVAQIFSKELPGRGEDYPV